MTASSTDVPGGEVVSWLQNLDGLNCAYVGQPQTLTLVLTNATDESVQFAAGGGAAPGITVDLSRLGTVTLSKDAVVCPGFTVESWENGILTLAVPTGSVTWLRGTTLSIALGTVTIAGTAGVFGYSVAFAGVSPEFDRTVPTSFVLLAPATPGNASAPSVGWTQRYRLPAASGQSGQPRNLQFMVTALPTPTGAPPPSVTAPTIVVMTVGSRVRGRTPLCGIAGMTVQVEDSAATNSGTVSAPLWRVAVPAGRFGQTGTGQPVSLIVSLAGIIPVRASGSGSLVVYTLGVPGCNDGFAVLAMRPDSNPAVITKFAATPETADGTAGPATVTLTWSVDHAAMVTLSGVGTVPADGNSGHRVTIEETTTFILTAYGDGLGSMDVKSCTVTVTPDLPSRLVPPGTIMMWSGDPAHVPPGWVVCDGNNGTPDLRDRFVLGAGGKAQPNDMGDGDSHSHGVPTLNGTFSFKTGKAGAHSHGMPTNWYARDLAAGSGSDTWSGIDSDGPYNSSTLSQQVDDHSHEVIVTFGDVATDPAGPVLPPWYALLYIMKS